MAKKTTTNGANLGFEDKLWTVADKLRGNMDAAEYKHVVIGSFFKKPMRVETTRVGGDHTWTVELVGTQSERFCKVTLTVSDIDSLTILDSDFSYEGTAAFYDRVRSGRAVARLRQKSKAGSR